MLRLPNAEEACRRVALFTQPQDIAPTLLDLCSIAQLAGTTVGASLLPIARGEVATGREYAITKLEIGSATEFAIRTNDWAYLLPTKLPPGETREPQLFGKPHDRWEVDDLRARNAEQTDELDEQLRKFITKDGEASVEGE
jgi:arylsulfatase A-like enzyme